jgi:CHAT domain-containing protein
MVFVAVVWIALVSTNASAQDDGIEVAIEQSQSNAANRELTTQANAEVPKSDDKHELSIFYHKRGHVRNQLGDYRRAAEDLKLALDQVQSSRNSIDGWGVRYRIENDLAHALESNGQWFAAVDHWKQVASLNQQSSPGQSRYAYQRLSESYSVLGDFVQAETSLKRANEFLPQLRSSASWTVWGFNYLHHGAAFEARFLERQGKTIDAERKWREALGFAEKDYELKYGRFGAKNQDTRGAAGNLYVARRRLARNLATQGKYGEAEILARQAFQDTLAMYTFNTTSVGFSLDVVAWTHFQQGDIKGAERYYRHALLAVEGSTVAPHSTALSARRAALANVRLIQGEWNDALKLYEERDRGLRSDLAQFKRIGSDNVGWAFALHRTGQSQRAAEMARRMVAGHTKRPVPDRWYVAQLRGVQGMALAASGNTTEALNAYRESIPDLIRRGADDSTADNTGYWRTYWLRVILEGYLELLATLHTSPGTAPAGLDLIVESFWVADVARGSGVQEAIAATAARAQLPDKHLAELARKDQDALNRIVALNQLLARLAAAPAEERLHKVVADMRAEIERLRTEHVGLRAEIRNRYPEYAELIDPKPAGLDDVRKALAPGEALVSIYLGKTQAYVWTIGADGKSAFRVAPVKLEDIENDIRQLRKTVDLGDGSVAKIRPFDLARAYKLYRELLEPDEGLWKNAQVLNVIPHGALGELPFALLVTAPSQQMAAGAQPGYADASWLARKVAIAQLPSASAFAALRRAPLGKTQRQPFIGFGDPLFTVESGARGGAVRNLTVRKIADASDALLNAAMRGGGREAQAATTAPTTLAQAFALLSALPDTSDELREIALVLKADASRDVFVNREATEKNVKAATLDDRRVVAFATHGIAPGELTGLDQPALALSNPAITGDGENDGFLTMEEVLGLKLDADWVVLSACNTGGADGRAGEAVSGLGRAFFFAGARSLLVSNWAVETTSARLLTTELFKRQAENPQITRAEALRQSMLSLMTKNATDAAGRASFSYAHPAFWAPFSLVGDSGSPALIR